DHLGDRAPADALLERPLVEDVPGARARLPRRRLDEVGLRPRDLAPGEELLAALVEDAREAAVELRERDELRLVEGRVGHVPAVELVHSGRGRRAALEAEAEAVACAPAI